MAAWPSSLPVPSSEGYSLAFGDQTIRTDMEAGYSRQRRRTSQRVDTLQVAWLFTPAQMNAFRTWFDGDNEGGAVWFTGLKVDVGDGVAVYTARFSGPPSAVFVAPYWRVNATLDIRDESGGGGLGEVIE